MVYLLTFTIKNSQMLVNTPYMDPKGKTRQQAKMLAATKLKASAFSPIFFDRSFTTFAGLPWPIWPAKVQGKVLDFGPVISNTTLVLASWW